MADGQQHWPENEFKWRRDGGDGEDSRDPQWLVDRDFNKAAEQQGYSVLRVQYDVPEAVMRECVLAAIRDCLHRPAGAKPFLRHGPGYRV